MANDYETRLRRVLDYIHDTPAGDLSLDALADVAARSRFHYRRVYIAFVGGNGSQHCQADASFSRSGVSGGVPRAGQ